MEQPVQVLLIEDNPLFVELTRQMLAESKSGDFCIECEDNLATGIDRLARGGIDAVLLDLTLPDSSGLDTFLKLHIAAKNVPTIIYTSVDDEALSLSALNLGAADYLVKSEVNANWLARSLVFAIQRSRSSQVAGDVNKLAGSVIRQAIDTERCAESETSWVAKVTDKRLVNISALEELKACLLSLLHRSDSEEVRVDMSRVEYIANAALSMLLTVHKRSTGAGKRLVLCELKPQVHEQCSSRHFDKLFALQRA